MRFKFLGKAFICAAVVLTAAVVSVLPGCMAVRAALAPYLYDGECSTEPAACSEAAAPAVTAASADGQGFVSEPQTEPAHTEDMRYARLAELTVDYFAASLDLDMGFDFERTSPFAEAITDRRYELLALDSVWRSGAQSALEAATASAAEECGVAAPECELEGVLPSWQLASALSWTFGREEAARLLVENCTTEASLKNGRLTARLGFSGFDKLISQGTDEQRFTADFVYSYFRTVFNEDMTLAESGEPSFSVRYLETIGFPLKNMLFYDSWYGPREYSTRYHLGMDIHARSDTPILSCTDGSVKLVGFDDTAGYYVVIEDAEGYEYHYYHMIRESDFLTAGDTVARGEFIGSVGSTGNSDGNHLHLSIITPEHVHVNPYIVMCTLRDLGAG